MIAAVCSWHEHHEAAANEIERRLAGRAKMIVAAPALIEAYAVLTRLSPPHRLSPQIALTLLENNFLKLATVIALNAKSYETLLLRAPKNNVAGGRVYDAVILKTLGATRLRLLGAYALEYLLIGLATAVFGVIAGSIAAWLIVTRLMTLTFMWQAGSAAGVVASALIVTVGLGLAGTLLALNQKPATVLRNL